MIGSVSLNAAPKIAIHRVYQKVVEATGQPYGSPGGIYFKYTDLEPFYNVRASIFLRHENLD